jgi:hypothetical protein
MKARNTDAEYITASCAIRHISEQKIDWLLYLWKDALMSALNYVPKRIVKVGQLIALAGRLLYRHGPNILFRKMIHRRQYLAAQRQIDTEYGTDTLSVVAINDLSATGPNVSYAIEYHPSPALEFDTILSQLPIVYSEFVFADLGCGKGLALILASRFGFNQIIGVEFGRTLYEIALINIDKFQHQRSAAKPIEVNLGDAAEFEFPIEPLVIYLYNPFGPEVIYKVLANLGKSLSAHPRNCWVVYMTPQHHELFANCGFLFTHIALTSRELGEPYALYTNQLVH